MARQVPLIGYQLAGDVEQLRRSSVIGLVAGLLALTWGTTGLAQAGLFMMAQVWNLPGLHGPATCSGWGAPRCSWACSGSE